MNIGFISLGCPKNLVDTEIMMALLKKSGHIIVNTPEKADLVVINTCGFITPAKEEAVNTIIETGKLKEKGLIKYIIASGCLSQRYGNEMIKEMPELDGVVGISQFPLISQAVQGISQGEKIALIGPPPEHFIEKGPRLLSTPPGYAYLKISEGCNNRCAYCAIPSIRGNLRSRPMEELEKEASELVVRGIKELVVVAQDTAAYGRDLYGKASLPHLLERLNMVEGLHWIRLMYLHPAHMDQEIIKLIADDNKIIPYLDIPVQHASPQILKMMNRKHDYKHLQKVIDQLRSNVAGVVLRTTVMLGFPGEDEDDFQCLYDFVAETEFDCLGAFAFTPEENTAAAKMGNQVNEEIKSERLDTILRLQRNISRKKNIARINSQQKILISSQISKNLYGGRGYYQAPEVDGLTLVKSNSKLTKGGFVDVKLVGVRNYDMIGESHNESTK